MEFEAVVNNDQKDFGKYLHTPAVKRKSIEFACCKLQVTYEIYIINGIDHSTCEIPAYSFTLQN